MPRRLRGMSTTTSYLPRANLAQPRATSLLRGHIGAALRRRRVMQQRTLRDVAAAAGVSLGYLSEVERGVKEPSSELLSAICRALDARLPDLLVEVADALYRLEVASAGGLPAQALGRVSGSPAPAYGESVQPPSAPTCRSDRAA